MQPSTALFLVSTLAVSASAVPGTRNVGYCTPSYGNETIIPNTGCTAECGLDRPGGNFEPAMHVANLEACAAACSSNPDCLTASFVPDTGYCYLKNFILNTSPNANVNGVICRTCASGSVIPGTQCTEECNVDRPGNDYKFVQFLGKDGLQRCGQLCDAEEECTTAQYRADNSFCYLKNVTNAAVPNTNVNGIVCSKTASH